MPEGSNILILLYTRHKGLQSLRCVAKDRNTRGTSILWTVGNGDPMHGACISHSIPRAWEQQG